MPVLLPFRGLRYARAPTAHGGCPDISPLTAPPYDVVDDPAVFEARHPCNAVRLVLPRDEPPQNRYESAAARLRDWEETGELAADAAPRLYRYSMSFAGPDGEPRHTVGVVGALGLPEKDGVVLPHERTLPKAKSDRLALLRATRANLDPIWVLSLADGLTARLHGHLPDLACATDDDGVRHELAAVDDPEAIDDISSLLATAPVVIADGHHRYETARAYHGEATADPAAGAVMALVVECAADQLHVAPIHRAVHRQPFLRARLAPWFTIHPHGPEVELDRLRALMAERHTLGLVDREGAALLTPTPALHERLRRLPRSLEGVDAARLGAAIDEMHLELGYHADEHAVAALVARGEADAGLLLRPVTVDQIRAVAAAGVRMPEKTSYFWPKPLTGMVFRSLDV